MPQNVAKKAKKFLFVLSRITPLPWHELKPGNGHWVSHNPMLNLEKPISVVIEKRSNQFEVMYEFLSYRCRHDFAADFAMRAIR